MNDHVILCDIDGVLADFVESYTKLGNKLFGTPIIGTSEMEDWSGFPMSLIHQNETWKFIYEHPDWWATLPLLVSHQVMTDLVQLPGIYFATNRPAGTLEVTTRWLGRYGSQRPRVIVTQEKPRLAGAMRPEWVLEDSPHNLLAMQQLGLRGVVRFRRRYNTCVSPENEDLAVDTVTEFLELVKGAKQ